MRPLPSSHSLFWYEICKEQKVASNLSFCFTFYELSATLFFFLLGMQCHKQSRWQHTIVCLPTLSRQSKGVSSCYLQPNHLRCQTGIRKFIAKGCKKQEQNEWQSWCEGKLASCLGWGAFWGGELCHQGLSGQAAWMGSCMWGLARHGGPGIGSRSQRAFVPMDKAILRAVSGTFHDFLLKCYIKH